jgi:two-component system, LuxR family, response regulator FixJ
VKHRVLIIDDEQSVRDSLSSVLATYGFRAASCSRASEAMELIRKSVPDCVVLDVRMPEMDGLALQRVLAQTAANLPVIMITGHADIAMAVHAMRNGAYDFIEKPIDDEQLVASINAAIDQRRQASSAGPDEQSLLARYGLLTDREKSVAEMVAEGYSSAAIASTFSISVRTVDHHRASVLAKMQATSLPQLIRYLLRILPSKP